MSNYLIGIGGTGQRVVNAFINACYMNAIWDENGQPLQDVSVMLIDKDNNTGNAASSKLQLYQAARLGGLAQANLKDLKMWEPVPATDFHSLGALSNDGDSQLLLSALFTEEERTKLSETSEGAGGFKDGFKGHPNVGATYQFVAISDGENNSASGIGRLMNSVRGELDAGKPVRVCIVASLFGGTGASGLPLLVQSLRTVAKNCGNMGNNLHIGAVMMLPYFQHDEGTAKKDMIGLAYSNRQTQAALRYYQNNGYMDNPDRQINETYLLGLRDLVEVGKYSEGGANQRNNPVFVELSAAMSARHFFITDEAANPRVWTIGCNCDPNPENVTQMEYGALIGDPTKAAKLQQTMLQALRYALFSQLYAYWGLVQWTSAAEDTLFQPDSNAKMWLKSSALDEIVEDKKGKFTNELRTLENALKSMMEQNLSFLWWLYHSMHHAPKAAENVVFPGFGRSQLETLKKVIEGMESAFRRDRNLPNDQTPVKTKAFMGGWQTSVCQQNWEKDIDAISPGDGANKYSSKVTRALNGAKGLNTLGDVLNLIYKSCE